MAILAYREKDHGRAHGLTTVVIPSKARNLHFFGSSSQLQIPRYASNKNSVVRRIFSIEPVSQNADDRASIPSGAKARIFAGLIGTAEAVPPQETEGLDYSRGNSSRYSSVAS
jgi:hypothetical protein